jgi:hypothetical protein
MLKSILAVIAGSVVWMATALGTDVFLMNVFPNWFGEGGRVDSVPVLLLMMCYSLGFSVLGGYVTGLIAGRAEVKHALALGLLQLAMGAVATAQHWDQAPAWYHVVFLALLVPANLLGGYLRAAGRGGADAPLYKTA